MGIEKCFPVFFGTLFLWCREKVVYLAFWGYISCLQRLTGCFVQLRRILSLFDESGVWSEPYVRAGYDVTCVDLSLGLDVLDFDYRGVGVSGILAAPPCTHFSGSGARWWGEKDVDGRTAEGLALIDRTLEVVDYWITRGTLRFWVLENPVGRLQRLRPGLGKPWYFQPWWYGDAYTKKTGLWGRFNRGLRRSEVEPVMYTDKNGKRGSWYWAKLGGTSERTKRLRSQTPPGFARAFFEANP